MYLHDNYFYLVPVILLKISKIINFNPFIHGYYTYTYNNKPIYDDDAIIKELEDKSENKLEREAIKNRK